MGPTDLNSIFYDNPVIYPPELALEAKQAHGYTCREKWCLEHWGTPSNAMESVFEVIAPERIRLEFETPMRSCHIQRLYRNIQWLFALPEPSRAQAQSPILTPAEITAIRQSSAAQENLKTAVQMMSGFYLSKFGCVRNGALGDFGSVSRHEYIFVH